jgi:anti-sigma regulatory factor (Ser/Thr protein kinase)
MNKLDTVSFDKLLAEQNPLKPPDGSFDLTGIDLITSAALVQLVVACHAIAQQGRQATITVPDAAVRRYLLRSRFTDAIKEIARIEPPFTDHYFDNSSFRHGSSPVLIEVTKFGSEDVITDVLNRIVEVLRNHLNFRKNDAFYVATAVSEICGNVIDHVRDRCGFIAMQLYRQRETEFVEVGVADYGEGLATTLSRNPKYSAIASDFQAIQLATRKGVSEHDSRTRGFGLYDLLRIANKLDGAVQIRSGSAKLRYRKGKHWGLKIPVPRMPGVQIAFTLQLRPVIDMTAEEE